MIKINLTSRIASYELDMKKNNSSKKSSTTVKKSSGRDELVLSAEGLEVLKGGKGVEEKSYDLGKVMEIHKKGFTQIPTREESEYYWAARKNDPQLDARLYAQDKAEALEFMGQVQNILLKALTGEKLTSEEEKLVKDDPYLQQEISRRQGL